MIHLINLNIDLSKEINRVMQILIKTNSNVYITIKNKNLLTNNQSINIISNSKTKNVEETAVNKAIPKIN